MSQQPQQPPPEKPVSSIAPMLLPLEPNDASFAETLTPATVPPTNEPSAVQPTGPAEEGAPPSTSVPGYKVLEELGRGGMGVVYRARQVNADRIVALKMILAGVHAGSGEMARFRTEAQAVARLHHPNVVQVYEVGEHEGRPYFSLEFCPGGSLEKKLSGTPMKGEDAAVLVEKLARAVQVAHAEQIIHRDLKPANVLLAEDGTPKITDFGLAKKLDQESGQTKSGAIMGTPSYMSPEQAEGRKDTGPAADIYALGAILYECVTGRPPFRAPTVMDTLIQVVSEEAVSPRQLNAKVQVDLETICLKCLQKEPGKRYASAQALAEDLRRFQAGEPIAARPVSRLERGWRWCRRNPALAAMTAAVFLLLTSGVTVASVLAVLADRRADEAAEARDRAAAEREKAEKKEAEAVAAQRETEKANNALRDYSDRLELSVARSLLRPLSLDGMERPLTEPEIEALWELSAAPGDGLRLKFVEDAFRSPATTGQLLRRAAFALHAAAGLDLARREKLEELLTSMALGDRLSDEKQFDLAMALARLGGTSSGGAAHIIAQAMCRTKSYYNARPLQALAEGLSAAAARMEAKEAAAVCSQAAATLALAMTKVTSHYTLPPLVQGLSALATHMKAKESKEAAAILSLAMTETTDPDALPPLAQGLSAVAARLEAKEAAAVCSQAAATLALAMTKTTAVSNFAQELSALAARMEPKEAAQARGQAAVALLQAMGKTTPDSLRYLRPGLSEVLVDPAQLAAHKGVTTVACIGLAPHPLVLVPLLPGVHGDQRPIPCRFSTADLIEMLKHPLCVSEARRVILDRLEDRYGQRFVDQWDFVRFATEKKLGLDFTTPPKRPETPAR